MGQLSATTNGSSTSTISLSSLASLFSKSANYEFKTNADGALQFNLVDIHADRLLSRVRKCHLHPVWLSVPRDNESNDERRIACVHVQAHHHPRFTFLCSHGGTTTLGDHINYYFTLAKLTGCNVLAYDYAGFGLSEGRLNGERCLLHDAEQVYRYAIEQLGLRARHIILHGQSLGTVPSIHLASMHKSVAGLILVSPFLCLPNATKAAFFQHHSIDKVEQINCAVLVVHGEQDRVTPIEQAREIVASCSSSVRPLFLDNIGHWDIELSPEYLNRVRDFIDKDMIKA